MANNKTQELKLKGSGFKAMGLEQKVNSLFNRFDSKYDMIKNTDSAPTHTPKNFFDQFYLYESGSDKRLYVYINNAWYFVRVDSSGEAYGEIYLTDGSTAQSIPTGATYTKLTGFATDGLSQNCTNDVANDKITITKTGRYLVTSSISGESGTANVEFKFAAFLNGTEQDQIHCTRLMATANDVGNMSLNGIIDVTTANWDLDLRVRHDNGGSVDFTPQYMNLSAVYIGIT